MKSIRLRLISILTALILLIGIAPISALAVDLPPEETPAETVWVGGVELAVGQYVKNGSTTAVTGEPDWNAGGFAYHESDGALYLVGYQYSGSGHAHGVDESSVIYSEGKLTVIALAEVTITNTASSGTANGIRVKGSLLISGSGKLTVNAPHAIHGDNDVTFNYAKTVIPNSTIGIEAKFLVIDGGVVQMSSAQPIEATEGVYIVSGSFTASAEQGVFKAAPDILADTENDYSMSVSYNTDGSVPQAYLPENITQYKYFEVSPPGKVQINSVSIGNLVIPEANDQISDFDGSGATCGGNYYIDYASLEAFVGGRWIEVYNHTVTEGIKYRISLLIEPNEDYSVSESITSSDILINGEQPTEFRLEEYPDYNAIEIFYEFHYGDLISSEPIGSIGITGLTLPTVGQTGESWPFNPGNLTFDGDYSFYDCVMQKFDGTEWKAMVDGAIQVGVRYRFIIELRAYNGYYFSPELDSEDVEIGDYDALLLDIHPTGEYAAVAAEFIYTEAPPVGYGILIADKDPLGATVGVEITEANRADVLGDGTVSYDPATSTLTLNGYKYEGEGFLIGANSYYGICVTSPYDDLTILLVGDSSITLTPSVARMMREPDRSAIELWSADLEIKGDGSLAISSPLFGIVVYGGEDDRGVLEINGGRISVSANEGLSSDKFIMTGGSVTANSFFGIDTYYFEMLGGSLTVNSNGEDSTAICVYDTFKMRGGSITVSSEGDYCYAVYVDGAFTMNGGVLRVTSDYEGISLEKDSTLVISGGILEISTKEAGYAFTRYNDDEGYIPTVPTVTGDAMMTASVSSDGSGAVAYDASAYETYKYVKIAFVLRYGIMIADKDGSGATVGVEITSENCADVLGDGTVSYDPATNTLTLKGYKYEGEGVLVDEGGYVAIIADIPAEGLTIALVGESSITVSGNESAGILFFEYGDLNIKGNGSLSVNSGMYGISVQTDSGRLTVEDADLDITVTGPMSIAIQANDFVMKSGDLKINSSMIGIGFSKTDGIDINGGAVEISTNLGGYAFIYLDVENFTFNPTKPDLSGYVGAYKMTAGTNPDGSGAGDFDEAYLNSYKYVRIAHAHTHEAVWKSDTANHWNECACGDRANIAPHADGNSDGKCDVCQLDIPVTGGEDDDGKGLGAGAIVGIVLGSVAVLGLGGFAIFWFVIKKKTFADLIAVFKGIFAKK